MEKQLEIEKLEKDREETLRLLNLEKQDLDSKGIGRGMRKENIKSERARDEGRASYRNELLGEAKRRYKERNIWNKGEKEVVGADVRSSEETYPTGASKLPTEPDSKQYIKEGEDFKEYIDREYQKLKLDLEALRKPQLQPKPSDPSLANFQSISNLSDISSKNNDLYNNSLSFTSNPFKSPKNIEIPQLDPNFLAKPKNFSNNPALKAKLQGFLHEKPQKQAKILTSEQISSTHRPKFTIESHNIEIKPETNRLSPKNFDYFEELDKNKRKETCRSSSDRKQRKERKRRSKDKKKGTLDYWDNQAFGYPAYPLQYPYVPMQFQGFNHPGFPVYGSGFGFWTGNREGDQKLAEFKSAFNEESGRRCFTVGDEDRNEVRGEDWKNISHENPTFHNQPSKFIIDLEPDVTNQDLNTETLESPKSLASDPQSISPPTKLPSTQTQPILNNLHLKDQIPTFGDESNPNSMQSSAKSSTSDPNPAIFLNIGDQGNKTLAEIFSERNPKTIQNMENRSKNLSKQSHRDKSQPELIEIRKNQLKPSSSEPCHKSPTSKRFKSSELTARLNSGARAKLSKNEILAINKKRYENLPEVKLKIEEEKKKNEWKKRLEKRKEYEKARFYKG